MKVLHFGKFYPPHRGGMENFLEMLCCGLAQRGVECEVIAARDRDDPPALSGYQNGVRLELMRSLGTVKSLSLCPAALGILRGRNADIINLHHPNPLAEISYFLSRPRGRLVMTYHSDIVSQPWLRQVHAPLLHWVLDRADTIVATSPQYAASSPVLQRYRDKVRIIPLGYEPALCPGEKLHLHKKDGAPQYFVVGRLVPYKGISVLIEALQDVPGNLWIAGIGPLETKLKRQAADTGLGRRVEFLGNISEEEKLGRLAACDVFVLPSINRAEAFGIVLLEAMAMGKPVVVSDLPTGVRLLVQDGVNGRQFPPGDARALAAILEELTGNPRQAAQMGSAGRRLFEEKYTTDRMVEAYLELYKELCQRG